VKLPGCNFTRPDKSRLKETLINSMLQQYSDVLPFSTTGKSLKMKKQFELTV
jgi:hypothetical protein